MAKKRELLRSAGREPGRLRRGDQEGVPQARHEAPPGSQPRQAGTGKRSSRKRRKPTRSSRRRRSAAPTTPTDSPACIRKMGGGRGPGLSAASPRPSADIFSDIFGGQGRGRSVRLSRRGPALQPRDLARASGAREPRPRFRIPTDGDVRRTLPRLGRPSRETQPKTCETCHGSGTVRLSQGFFLESSRPARHVTAPARW